MCPSCPPPSQRPAPRPPGKASRRIPSTAQPQRPVAAIQLLQNHPWDCGAAFPPFSPESTCFMALTRFPGVGKRLPAGSPASWPAPAGDAAAAQENCCSHVPSHSDRVCCSAGRSGSPAGPAAGTPQIQRWGHRCPLTQPLDPQNSCTNQRAVSS